MAPMERSIVTMTGTRPSRFQELGCEGPVSVLEIPERIWGQVRRDKVHDTYRDVFRKEGWMTGQFIDAIAEGKSAFPDFQEGAFIQRILDAALLSDLEHRSVSPMEILS